MKPARYYRQTPIPCPTADASVPRSLATTRALILAGRPCRPVVNDHRDPSEPGMVVRKKGATLLKGDLSDFHGPTIAPVVVASRGPRPERRSRLAVRPSRREATVEYSDGQKRNDGPGSAHHRSRRDGGDTVE